MSELDRAYDSALGRFNGANFLELDELDQILVTIWGLEADVNNGGFDQYYFNGSGDQSPWAPEALRTIGAYKMADIVARANSVFGPDGPSHNRSARQAQLFLVAPPDKPGPWEALDEEFFAYPDDISMLMEAFLRSRGRTT